MENNKEVLERLEKSISSLTDLVGELSLKVKELDNKTSFPIDKGKIMLSANELDEWKTSPVSKPDLKHYYGDGMPKLDKYLAYLDIESKYFVDGFKRFLITKDFNMEFTLVRFTDAKNNFIRINFRGLKDVVSFKNRTVQFRFNNDKTVNLDYLTAIQQSFNRVIDNLANGKNIYKDSIYGDSKNEFRSIKVKDWGNLTVSIENTIYSSYSAMEENEPLYKEVIYGQAEIRVYE